ncbi:alpha/beta fold hydrolase [Parvularcula lutaonensis]|uniref:Alpha/beta fold hydrolase n=1 Tax=Parvularcula lutaonensis TaxID=491923 RepID=A0ABV7MC67_9PROT|nr:alpha/beta hydrolase [Parvularcula lutaonensis]GGY49843.1 alpha/beta hydrolase [Parvularcula lutaonensis]
MRKLLAGLLVVLAAGAVAVLGYNYKASQGVDQATVEEAYLETQDQFVPIDGLEVRVRDEGPRDAPVLLMLHGFTFSLESFDALAERLSTDYRVIRYDLRGHGLTGPDPQKRYSPAQRAEHIGAVLDTLGIERATIIGNSLGGLASWRFAAENPSRVEALVLISPGAYPINGVSDEPAPVPPLVEAYLRTVPEAGLEASLSRIYADPSKITPERKAEIRAMMRREGNGEAFVDALKVFTLPDPEPMLARVEAPTLIIWGREDQVISPDDGSKMVAVMPRAELVLLEDIGHVAHEEDPERVAREIERFLSTTGLDG